MAKGNDGNYLQHCIEVEAATHLTQFDPKGRLHIALTHGMKPSEKLDEPRGSAHRLLYDALLESEGQHQCNERLIVKAYRKTTASRESYPNTAKLLRAVIGTDKLSGGITEVASEKYKVLADAWSGSRVNIAYSSWRKQLGPDGVLACPDHLEIPWLFSMDPMTYKQDRCKDDDRLYYSDIGRLVDTLGQYIGSEQPGIAALFVYNMGIQGCNAQKQFWRFICELERQLGMHACHYWLPHRGGNLNLAGLLYSDTELSVGFNPPCAKRGEEININHSSLFDT